MLICTAKGGFLEVIIRVKEYNTLETLIKEYPALQSQKKNTMSHTLCTHCDLTAAKIDVSNPLCLAAATASRRCPQAARPHRLAKPAAPAATADIDSEGVKQQRQRWRR